MCNRIACRSSNIELNITNIIKQCAHKSILLFLQKYLTKYNEKHVMARVWCQIWKVVKRFLSNSSIHGIGYLVEDNLHWTEKLFWIIFCVLSWYGCTNMICGVVHEYIVNPIAITLDTSYLDFKTSFATLAVCSKYTNAAKDVAMSIFKDRNVKAAKVLSQQLFSTPRKGYLKELKDIITTDDLKKIYSHAKVDCSEIFEECSWNGKSFDCCNEFALLQSSVGYCHMLNSRIARPSAPVVDFSVDRVTKYGHLSINFTKNFPKVSTQNELQFFILNNLEVPTSAHTDKEIPKSKTNLVEININILDVNNERGISSISIGRRGCRFPFENEGLKVYEMYTYDTCSIEDDIKVMLKECNCVNYMYPYTQSIPVCNMSQMYCISQLPPNVKHIDCTPDCEEADISWTSRLVSKEVNENLGLRVRLLSLPHKRMDRYIVHDELDLIVSIGSAIGLFMGASILSIVEILYWLCFYRDMAQ